MPTSNPKPIETRAEIYRAQILVPSQGSSPGGITQIEMEFTCLETDVRTYICITDPCHETVDLGQYVELAIGQIAISMNLDLRRCVFLEFISSDPASDQDGTCSIINLSGVVQSLYSYTDDIELYEAPLIPGRERSLLPETLARRLILHGVVPVKNLGALGVFRGSSPSPVVTPITGYDGMRYYTDAGRFPITSLVRIETSLHLS